MNATAPLRPQHDPASIRKAASALGILGGAGLSASRVMAALCMPSTSLDEVSRLISQEPCLAARVLKVANSAYYGLSRNVTTIERALVVLGMDAMRGIAAAACLDRTMMRAPESALIQRQALVTHSLATGTAAEMLARPLGKAKAGEAFIAGLLHNLGLPVQAMLGAASVQALMASLAEDPHQEIRALEARHGLVSHEICAGVVFESWRLPAALIDGTTHHHQPDEAPEAHRPLAWLVHVGMQVAAEAGFGFPLEPRHEPCGASRLAGLRIEAERLDEVREQLPGRLEALTRAFSA
jgi:HD-like signal output (HDOD) protein